MSRKIKISASVLNVRLHPHSVQIYDDFILALYNLKRPVRYYGDRKAMISTLDRSDASSGFIRGVITTFVEIDTSGSWFNSNDMQEATDDEISQINIPTNLKPNSASFFFRFELNSHKLYIQTYSKGKVFTINSALKTFQNLSEDLNITKIFNTAKITIVQDHIALDKILTLAIIKELSITVERPNPDIFADDFEDQVERHLEATNSKRVRISYQAEPGQSVKPTAEIAAIGRIALENGRVEARGRNADGAVTISTDDYPRVLQEKFDPDLQSESQAFEILVGDHRSAQ